MRSPSDNGRPLIAVLGASGFIGAAVAGELAALPYRLRLVARRQRLTVPPSPAEVEDCAADLTDAAAVAEAVAGADAIIHLANHIGGERSWREPGGQAERLGAGLLDTLAATVRAGGGPPPVAILASTVQADVPAGHPVNEYVRQKLAAEQRLRAATQEGVLRGIVLRLSTVYGRTPLTGSTGRGVVAATARRALAGEPITMWHDGSVRRDLVHVTDVARAFVAAVRRPDDLVGACPAVGTGRAVPLGDVFRTVAALVAERSGREPVPVVTVPPPEWADANDFETPAADPAAFVAATGWRPRVELRAGLTTVVEALMA